MTESSLGWADIPPERRVMLEAVRDSVCEPADYTGQTISQPLIVARPLR